MKLPILAVVVAAAGFAQVSAAPLRVMIIGPGQDDVALARPANIGAMRLGHPVPTTPLVDMGVKQPMFIAEANKPQDGPGHHHRMRPCGGMRRGRFHQKAVQVANAFRHAFGLPLIEAHHHRFGHHGGPHHIHHAANIHTEGGFVTVFPIGPPGMTGGHPYLRPHPGFYQHGKSFMQRLHFSLMNLGPWEGRAVAFVLGCGIGVLIRMIWVLFIVGFRAIKGSKPEEQEYGHIILIEEETVAPPSYTEDKKVPIEEESK